MSGNFLGLADKNANLAEINRTQHNQKLMEMLPDEANQHMIQRGNIPNQHIDPNEDIPANKEGQSNGRVSQGIMNQNVLCKSMKNPFFLEEEEPETPDNVVLANQLNKRRLEQMQKQTELENTVKKTPDKPKPENQMFLQGHDYTFKKSARRKAQNPQIINPVVLKKSSFNFLPVFSPEKDSVKKEKDLPNDLNSSKSNAQCNGNNTATANKPLSNQCQSKFYNSLFNMITQSPTPGNRGQDVVLRQEGIGFGIGKALRTPKQEPTFGKSRSNNRVYSLVF